MSGTVVGGEYWNKFKLAKNPAGAARHQANIDHSTARHELVDVQKSRRRGLKSAAVCYEKTTVKIDFPVTEPANMLTGTHYCGRSWVI